MINLVQFPGLGLSLHINRVAISLGGFNIYWYGIILAAGLMGGLLFAFRYGPDFGIDTDRMADVVVIGTVMAIVCARIYYVAMAPFQYQSVWEMIDLRNGGIAIYGALIGAFVFGGLACKWRKIPLLQMFDLVAMGFLIGQGIGRWGNFVNAEVYGRETSSFLRMSINGAAGVHPLFLYESVWNLFGLILLLCFRDRKKADGQVFFAYSLWYGVGRLFLEGMRQSQYILYLIPNVLGISQVVALAAILVSAGCIVYLGKHKNG